MQIKRIIFSVLLLISWANLAAQDISDISRKMSFPADLPTPRFIIPLSDTLNGVSIRMDDFKSITPEKLNLAKNVEYVELCFSDQSDLNTLVGLLANFKRLKYLKFSDNAWASKVSLDSLILPSEISNYKNIIAVNFSGGWQIDYAKSLKVLHQLPKLTYFFFENLKQEIPTELGNFVDIKGLSIYDNNGVRFPDWIVKFSKLESISIGFSQYKSKGNNYLNYSDVFNKLERFPKLKSIYINYMNVFKGKYDNITFKNLEKLVVYSGRVEDSSDFFKFLSNHRNLRSLELSSFTFDTLKQDLIKLKKLETLSIESLKRPFLTNFSLKELEKLKKLKLSNFINFPDTLEFPRSLIELNLSSNAIIKYYPRISDLYNLQVLNLQYNAISSLPNDFIRLKKITHLDLSNNKITQLPVQIGELRALKVLNLLANPLKELPISFGYLKNLTDLNISYCDLKAFPESFGELQNLKTLKVSSNFIHSLPTGFSKLINLEHANFSENNLTNVPTDLGSLLNLTYLNFGSNNITKLPSSIGKLRKLEELNLSANDLTLLPEELGLLSALKNISLDNISPFNKNFYSPRSNYRIDDPKPKRILTNNTIQNLPKNLTNWSKLKTLNMSNHTTLDDVELFKSLFTISAKGFSVEFENINLTTLPLTGWANFNVKVLNLGNNKLTSIPSDIINAPYLESYNFNNNRLPSKPINLNSYAANKYQKLLWFKEFGFIGNEDLPKVDSMVIALVDKGNNHYYRKEFKQAVDYANQAIDINKELALSKIFKTNLGEAHYEVGNYKQAIEYLSQAIKRDTVGPVRIMNFITPDFEFRAKSYLKLGDTLRAIKDYEVLAKKFRENVWGDVGILYLAIGDKINAKSAFDAGIENYQQEIELSKKQKNNVELQQISLLELFIIAEQFLAAESYTETLKNEIKNPANKTLFAYLTACAKIGTNKTKEIDFSSLENEILSNKKNITNWSYDLFFKWLRITKIDKEKETLMRKLTDLIKPVS